MKAIYGIWPVVVGCVYTSTGDSTPGAAEPSCDDPGIVCTWLGVPQTSMFSGEGTDRSQDVATGTFLYLPLDITFADDGTAYYADFNNHRVREVSVAGVVTTISGTGFLGDGPNLPDAAANCWDGCDALDSAWNHPVNVEVNPADATELYVAAWHNTRINRIDTVASTLWWFAGGNGSYNEGVIPNTAEYDLSFSGLAGPTSISFGPDGSLFFSDPGNDLVRKIAPGGDRVEIAAGTIVVDVNPLTGLTAGIHHQPGYEGDGGDALLAKLHGQPDAGMEDAGSKIVVDGNRLLIADTFNGVIRSLDLDTGVIDTMAGRYESLGEGDFYDSVTGESYVADLGSVPGYAGDGGDALDATFNLPHDIAVGLDGEIYVADTKNHCVRVIQDGVVDTFAGMCNPDLAAADYSGDGGPATEASFTDVFGVEVDALGDVYIADSGNHILRRVRPVR